MKDLKEELEKFNKEEKENQKIENIEKINKKVSEFDIEQVLNIKIKKFLTKLQKCLKKMSENETYKFFLNYVSNKNSNKRNKRTVMDSYKSLFQTEHKTVLKIIQIIIEELEEEK